MDKFLDCSTSRVRFRSRLIATMNIFLYNHCKSPLHNLGLPRIRYSFLNSKIIVIMRSTPT
uniref:Uncharacterized protein n=1 Tax=Siphoviridae sp. ct7EW56 TaxID=2827562 RepID=A0A8S5LS74_9CAUD|nr:MAG TPA: hypothetical protein [Siphoviridae sp. ct7EW56]